MSHLLYLEKAYCVTREQSDMGTAAGAYFFLAWLWHAYILVRLVYKLFWDGFATSLYNICFLENRMHPGA